MKRGAGRLEEPFRPWFQDVVMEVDGAGLSLLPKANI